MTTTANVADSRVLPERKVRGDGGYQRQIEAIREAAPKAQDMTCKKTRFKRHVDELQKKKNQSQSSVRSKVEHPFRILKRIFGFATVRYRGLAKNHHRLCANFALGNLPPLQTPESTQVELRLKLVVTPSSYPNTAVEAALRQNRAHRSCFR